MKKTIFLASLLGLFFTPVFSQVLRKFKADTSYKDNSTMNHLKSLNYSNSQDFGSLLKDSVLWKFHNSSDFEKKFKKGSSQSEIAVAEFYGNMPCIISQERYSMRIYKHDSTERYNIMNKKLKKYPFKSIPDKPIN